ncbi:hypothetical protein GCM10010166_61420 [Couchioplanes caeruleus subsp. azureus]|nr:hypothetical protein GCM10010166_61420 [Couchioplanes caeruleus subsp. azureus]
MRRQRHRRRRPRLLIEILILLAAAALSLTTNYLSNQAQVPTVFRLLRGQALVASLALVAVVVLLVVWRFRVEAAPDLPIRAGRSPFPGLEAFGADDAAVFFGRDEEIGTLLERLNAPAREPASRVIAIAGPSGVGKSSLVHAGVVARLRNGRRGWLVAPTVFPGEQPTASLAAAITATHPCGPAVGGSAAEQSHHALQALRLRPDSARRNVLVVVDQAEELYTLAGLREREHFLSVLEELLSVDRHLWVVLIMRSEFLTELLSGRFAHLCRNLVTVGALPRPALIEVVRRPAETSGLRFEPATLPERIADDAGSGLALPLLAYTMQQLCAQAGGSGVLTLTGYQALGGVVGVLARRADGVAADLRQADDTMPVLPTLLKFVALTDSEPTRRRVRRAALDTAESAVVEGFLAARLLSSDGGRADPGATLEVAHEALFRYWPPLRQEIEARRDALRWRSDLERWAADWRGSGRDPAYLLHGERLRTALTWRDSLPELTDEMPEVAEFLEHSRHADHATMELLSETIARQALAEVNIDPEYAIRLALAAFEDCRPTRPAYNALVAALVACRVRHIMTGHDERIWSLDWSPDGRYLATASLDRTARVWDIATGREVSVLRGHADRVRTVAWSPDGRRLVTGSEDGSAGTWEPKDGAQLHRLTGHDAAVWGVAWAPDSRRVATASADGTARVWNADTGSVVRVLRAHEDRLWNVAWSPDGTRLATSSADGTVRIWNADNSADPPMVCRHDDMAWGLAWSPDGRHLVTGSQDRTARIWDAASGDELAVLRGHQDWVWTVAFSPDGTRIATASEDRTARIWDAASGDELAVLRGHQDWVWTVAFSPDGTRIATASGDRSARIWEASNGSELTALRGHTDRLRKAAWSPDGRHIATASEDRTARIWDTEGDFELGVLRGHTDRVRAVAWSPDGARMATGAEDRTVRLWDAARAEQLVVLDGHTDRVRGVAWSPDGTWIVTASEDRTVRLWRGGVEQKILHCESELWAVDWSPDGTRIAAGCTDHTVRLWDAAEYVETGVLRGHDHEVRAVAWSPDGRRLVSSAEDHTARIWHPDRGKVIVLTGHTDMVNSVSWSPDGQYVVTGSGDHTARIWAADSGQEQAVLRGHLGGVWATAWSPDNRGIATSSDDLAIYLWDPADPRQPRTIGVVTATATSIAFSPDSQSLATASDDRTVTVWATTTDIGHLVAMARRRARQPLSDAERHKLMLPDAPWSA